ncbi:MAG: hypothetical protein JW833_08555 [Prolixibacteraceae bacterium]|nr:hypothetical protein [Prolixibacteraceae bacterium]
MIDFRTIRAFAAKHFYTWPDGQDFNWLRKNWHKFEQYFSTESEAEDFIIALSYIYMAFCIEAYFEKPADVKEYLKISWFVEDYCSDEPFPGCYEEQINRGYKTALEILRKNYHPDDILREFSSIKIDEFFPHPDGQQYIYDVWGF